MQYITEKAWKYIKDWAYDSYEIGHPMDCDDYDEFAMICLEDGIEPSQELFDLYFEYFNEASDE